ncbi:MAG TPA: glycosyltransferase family 9 protein [Bordetella sp.]|nr:glycosyltransferase family 9 protein [Bordetella sp.]
MRDIVVYIRSRAKFGDQVVSFPALYQLKQWWPHARLRVVVQHDVSDYYRLLPWVDECVQAPGLYHALWAMPWRADLVVCLHHSSERYGLISLLRWPKARLGFRNGRLLDFAWTHAWRKNINEYIGLANLYLLSTYRQLQPEITVRRCFEEIAALAPRYSSADIVLIPGGGDGDFKRWGINNFVALADLLKARLGAGTHFTFVLGPAESTELAALQALERPDFQLVSGRPIPELAALMLDARLVVANDCGPSHIGQGVCVSYVGIFNESNPEWFWDRSYTANVCPPPQQCDIQAVLPSQVAEACFQVLCKPRRFADQGSRMPTWRSSLAVSNTGSPITPV